MRLPFFGNGRKKRRDQIIAVDMGTRRTKAVLVERHEEKFALAGFALLDAPAFDKTFSLPLLTEHLQALYQALGGKSRAMLLTVRPNDSVVRNVEMPQMPLDEMRMALRHNSKNYLQQDLTNYVFDCH